MNKLLIIDKHNRVLVSMNKEETDQIILDKSVEITDSKDCMVIKLKEDYWTHWNAIVKIVDWEIMFEVDQ